MTKPKKVVITGASSGIGAECAHLFQAQGWRVVGIDRNPVGRSDVEFFQIDLADPASIDNGICDIGSEIDALCNIAGLPPTASREAVLSVNFLGLRRLTESLIENFSPGASIVNLASLAGFGWPDRVPQIKKFIEEVEFDGVNAFCEEHGIDDAQSYFFSKELLIAWTALNRWTWRDRDIRMNCVSPGPVETPILADFVSTLGERAEEDMRIMDRPGRPDDIAPVVMFLAGENSKWIRGANIPADGGMYQHLLVEMSNLG